VIAGHQAQDEPRRIVAAPSLLPTLATDL